MHEEDQLDRMLESSLSSYGDPGADAGTESGLAERILARVSSEQSSDYSAPRRHSRFLLWAALPVAACLLLTFLLLKPAGPAATHQSASLPQPASTGRETKAPAIANITSAQKTLTHCEASHAATAHHRCCEFRCSAQAQGVSTPPAAFV